MAGVFGCASECDVHLLLCEVLGLQKGDALFEGRARNGRVLKDCAMVRWEYSEGIMMDIQEI